MDESWFAIPFENQENAERLEDLALAATIPRVAILNPTKSTDDCQLKDIKSIIMRNQSSEQAVREVMDRLAN